MQEQFETIQTHLDAAQMHLIAIRAEMQRLEADGMYDSVPTESWQTRNGVDNQYLYHLFGMDRDGGYTGPDGKRKVYVGCRPERIAQARALANNRRRYDELARAARDLALWLDFRQTDLKQLANACRRWTRTELGPPATSAIAGSGPKE